MKIREVEKIMLEEKIEELEKANTILYHIHFDKRIHTQYIRRLRAIRTDIIHLIDDLTEESKKED